jgi:predicted Zn-dependent protease
MKQKLTSKLKLLIASSISVGVAASLLSISGIGCGGSGGGGAGTMLSGAGAIFGGGGSGRGGGGGTIGTVVEGANLVKRAADALSLDEREERAMGQAVALEATARDPVLKDEAVNRYVLMVGQAVADSAPSGGSPVVIVLDTQKVNAYAAPSGYVMITRGLLTKLGDESELAGVLAHEIGHVAEQHGLKNVKDSALANVAIDATAMAARKRQLGDVFKQVVGPFLDSAYSQGQEKQADVDAVRLTAAAGYDPQGYVRALQRLQAEQGRGGGALSTHPDIRSRIATVSAQIRDENLTGGQRNRERFLAMTRSLRR